MRRISAKEHRSFYHLFLQMALVLLIPILLIFGSFFYSLQAIVLEDYLSMNNQIIDNVCATFDTAITSQITFAYALRNMNTLRQLSANLMDGIIEERAAYQELRMVISSMLYNNISTYVAIYFPDLDLVVSTESSVASPEQFYLRYIHYDHMNSDAFYEQIQSIQRSQFSPSMPCSPTLSAHYNLITYALPISQGYLTPRAYFLSFITEDQLKEMVLGSFDSDVRFQLFDDEGNELFRSGGISNEWSELASSEGSIRSADSGTYQIFTPQSLTSGLRLVFYVPESTVMRQIDRFVLICLAAMVICVGIGLLIATRLAWRLYTPFKKLLVAAFPEGLSRETANMSQGFALVADRLLETQLMNDRFRDELHAYFRASRDNALIDLITRSAFLSDEELNEAAEICKLPVSYYSYQVAIFKSESSDYELPETWQSNDDDSVLMTAHLAARCLVAVAALPRHGDASPLLSLIGACAGSCQVGLSRIHTNIRDLSRCVAEANMACQSAPASDNPPPEDAPTVYYPIERELQIIAATREGVFADVSRQLSDLREYNRSAIPTEGAITTLCANMTSTALKLLEQLPAGARQALEDDARGLIQLDDGSMDEDRRFAAILTFYEKLCSAAYNDNHLKNQIIIENVRQYLHENYMSPIVCLDSVAEHLNVSYYFLSRIFKSETNQSFSDMLNDTRIHRAMELLRTTQLPVQTISEQVGYTNWSTFLRAFRKRAGSTPLQYRNAV